MVTCSNCGTELSAEAKFCRKCGKKVESAKKCAGCGHELDAGAVFCINCGKRYIEEEIQPTPDIIESGDEETILKASKVSIIKGEANFGLTCFAQDGNLEFYNSKLIYANATSTGTKVKESMNIMPMMFGAIGGLISAGISEISSRKQKSGSSGKIDDIVFNYRDILYIKSSKYIGQPSIVIALKNGQKFTFTSNLTDIMVNRMVDLVLSAMN